MASIPLHFRINHGFIILVKRDLKFTPILKHSHPIIKEINKQINGNIRRSIAAMIINFVPSIDSSLILFQNQRNNSAINKQEDKNR